MANVFHKKTTKLVPTDAVITGVSGLRVATWTDTKGKRRTPPVSDGTDGLIRIVLVSMKWYGTVDPKPL